MISSIQSSPLIRALRFLVFLAPFTAVVVYHKTLFPFIVGKFTFFRFLMEVALIVLLWAWANGDLKRFFERTKLEGMKVLFKNPIVIAVSVFVLMFLLAGMFGVNPSASFWSNYERGEGGFQLIHLYVFFLSLVMLFQDEASWRKFFGISLIAGGVVLLYGTLGALGVYGFEKTSFCNRFGGSLGNPAYLGTYLIFMLFYTGYLWFSRGKIKKNWFLWGALALLWSVFLLLTQTRGALIGLGAGVIFALLYLSWVASSWRSRGALLGAVAILVGLGTLGVIYREHIDLMPFCSDTGGNRILNIAFETETYQTRLALWKGSWGAFLDRPLFGWGPENFSIAIERNFQPELSSAWFDRAHNIFFDYLAMTGLMGLLSFLSLFLAIFFLVLKHSKKVFVAVASWRYTNALVLGVVAAYLTQGLVLFDVLPIYLNVFTVLAFVTWKYSSTHQQSV